MISLLIYVLMLCVIFGLVWWVFQQLPLPAPFGNIARVVVIVIFALILLNILLGLTGTGGLNFNLRAIS